jgi:FkbM family methyltransferase
MDRHSPIYLGDHKLLVRATWGGLMVIPTFNVDVVIGLVRDGVIEPWTTRLVQELLREGQVAINIGANFGYYPCLAGHIVGPSGKMIAVEANPHLIPFLMNTCCWSGLIDRVAIYHRAAWSRDGETLEFQFAPAYIGGGSAMRLWNVDHSQLTFVPKLEDAMWDADIAYRSAGLNGRIGIGHDKRVKFSVTTATLDAICADIPEAHRLHMDIEGAEAHTLAGAHKLIERSPHLRIIFEWSAYRYTHGTPESRTMFEEMWRWLHDRGFYVRKLHASIGSDGGISLSEPLSFDYMVKESDGDFVALRAADDPWLKPPEPEPEPVSPAATASPVPPPVSGLRAFVAQLPYARQIYRALRSVVSR